MQNTPTLQSTVSTGVKVLQNRGLPTQSYYYWIGVGGLIGFILLYNLLFTIALSYFHRKCIHWLHIFWK